MYGDGGMMGADEEVLWGSYVHDRQLLPALDGWVEGVDFPDDEKHGLRAVAGLETAGLRALRNSV